jgi:hypothetical protein
VVNGFVFFVHVAGGEMASPSTGEGAAPRAMNIDDAHS